MPQYSIWGIPLAPLRRHTYVYQAKHVGSEITIRRYAEHTTVTITCAMHTCYHVELTVGATAPLFSDFSETIKKLETLAFEELTKTHEAMGNLLTAAKDHNAQPKQDQDSTASDSSTL